MDTIEELLTRGVANIIPGKAELTKQLQIGKKLNIYLGIDPTSTKIHLGHAVALRKLQAFADLGHHVTFLIGDFTALIGDTSDKETERPILTDEEIKKNFQTYKAQAEKLVDFSKIKILHNSEWLSKLAFKDIVKLTKHFSVNDFISRELISKRLKGGKHVRLDEVLYPIMQGFDSYHLNTDLQLGGADQTFNMQAGRTLQKTLREKESFVLATEYLVGTDGRKMSKSWGNAIWIDDTAEDIYAKVMAINDELIIAYYTLATNVPMQEIKEAAAALKKGEHPMKIKKELAFEIVEELCGLPKAEKAKEAFENRVQKKEIPTEIPTIIVNNASVSINEILVETGLASSRGEAKRLIDQGGVEVNNEKIDNPTIPFDSLAKTDETIIQVGKRKFVKIKVEE